MAGLHDFLPDPQVERLRDHSITSIDDLFALLKEDRRAVSGLLEISEDDADSLDAALRSATSPAVIEAVESEDDTARPLDAPPEAIDETGSDA